MAPLIGQLLPPILGAALAPVWLIIVLLLLASPRGLLKASAFLLGMTVVRLLQGLVFGAVFNASPYTKEGGAGPSPVVATLLLLAGILLLVTAFKTWRKEEDPDAPPPKWMQTVTEMPPLKALASGAALTGVGLKMWVFTLTALAIISGANLGQPGSTVAYLVYIVLAQSLLILSILVFGLVPQAAASLRTALDWLTRYNRPITTVVMLIFGLYFTWNGISGLLA